MIKAAVKSLLGRNHKAYIDQPVTFCIKQGLMGRRKVTLPIKVEKLRECFFGKR